MVTINVTPEGFVTINRLDEDVESNGAADLVYDLNKVVDVVKQTVKDIAQDQHLDREAERREYADIACKVDNVKSSVSETYTTINRNFNEMKETTWLAHDAMDRRLILMNTKIDKIENKLDKILEILSRRQVIIK